MKSNYGWGESGCGSTTALGAQLGDGLVGQFSAFIGFLELLLSLAEFGQIEGGDLFGFLNLSLVRLDLLLELVNQILHPLVVLAVLVGLERQFLDATLRLAQVLLGVGVAALLSVQLRFQSAHSLLQLLDGLLASLEGVVLGFVQSDLEFLDLELEGLALLLLGLGVLLFGSQFVGQTGSIDHGLLGLLLAVLGLVDHVVQVGVQGLQLGFHLPLGGG